MGGDKITGLAAGSTAAGSTEAINGGQVNTALASVATNLGGTSVYDPVTGTVTAPSITVGGTTYTNVTDAVQAAGAGFSLTTGKSGTGVANGTTVEGIAAGETVTVVAGNNLISTQTGNQIEVALNPVLTGITSLAVTGGATIDGTGIAMGGDKITGLAAGSTAAGSTEAINGGQVNTALASVATNLGGTSVYDPVTGTVTAPSYTIGATTYNNVGDALGALNTAAGSSAYFQSNSTGPAASAVGTDSIAMGTGAKATNANDVALGAGSITGAPHVGSFSLNGGTVAAATTATTSVVSIGDVGAERQLQNVAAGVVSATSTDAVNGSQLFMIGTALNNVSAGTVAALGGGATVAPDGTITAPDYVVAGNTYNDVGSALAAQGKLGVQYTPDLAGNPTAVVDLASNPNLPSGTTTVALNGVANATTSSGAVALGQMPMQYATSGAPTTANPAVPSNDVTLVGSAVGPVALHNVALGSLTTTSTDAVNGSQVNTALASVATNLGGTSKFDPLTGTVTAPSITVGGTTYTNVTDAVQAAGAGFSLTTSKSGTGVANGTTVEGIAAGETVTVVAGNNLISTQTGNQIEVALNPALTAITSIAVIGGATIDGTGIAMGGDKITGLAAGSTAAGSTEAINGGQVNTALASVATNLGGTSAYDPVTGTVTAPSITVGGTTYTNVTDAVQAAGAGFSLTTGKSGTGVANGTTVEGIAAGETVTVVAGNNLISTQTGNQIEVALNPVLTGITSLAVTGGATIDGTGIAMGGDNITGLAAGSTAAGSTEAINGSQVNTALASVATNLGGTSKFDPLTGTVTAPSITVGGTTYTNVTDAVQAAGAGFSLTTGKSGTGVANGTTVEGIAAGETVTVVAGNNLISTQTGNQIELALNSTLTGLSSIGVTGGPTIDGTGIAMNSDKITGLAAGSTTAGSTEAINGGQLNTALASVATNLGGTSVYDPVTGTVTAPSYTIGATTYNDVGSALTALDNSFKGGAGIKYFHANSTLADSSATGSDSVAIGPMAAASKSGSIALGANSIADRGAITAIADPLSLTGGTVTTTTGELSVGSTAAPRQITNVAAGTQVTDAVNVGQITPIIAAQAQLGTTTAAALGGGATYDPATGKIATPSFVVGTTTYTDVGAALAGLQSGAPVQYATAGAPTTPNGLVPSQNMTLVGAAAGPVTLDNVAAGSTAAGSTQAINGGQLNTGLASVATNFGGGSVYDPVTGQVTAPSYTVAGNSYNNVGGAVTALDTAVTGVQGQISKMPIDANNTSKLAQPSATGSDATAVGFGASATGTNSVAIGAGSTDGGKANVVSVGAVGAERQIVNVAAGSVTAASTDAINGGQLFGLSTSTAAALGGGSVVNPDGSVSAPSYSVDGNTYNSVGGAVAALDTGLAAVQTQVANFPITANNTSMAAQPTATGTDATAVGYGATASGTNSVAIGSGSTDGGKANVVSVGAVGAERQIVNVADGSVTATSTDAINGSQLHQTNQQVAALGHSAVQYATTPAGSTTSEINLASDAGGPVIIHNLAPGVAATDAANVGQLQAVAAAATNAVKYDKKADGTFDNSVVTFGSTTAPVALRNVAAAVKSTDAVNLAQLQSSMAGTLASSEAYTNQQVSNLRAFTEQGLREANAAAVSGTALALAGTGLRYDERGGRTSIAGALAFYQGTTGLAFGIGHTSEDQAWRYNVSVNGTPWAEKAEIGVVVGASYSFK
jgi:trimeric autotransporter adhesin